MRSILDAAYVRLFCLGVKRWPTTTAVKFGRGCEQDHVATYAAVHTVPRFVEQRTCVRPFCSRLSRDMVGQRREQCTPFFGFLVMPAPPHVHVAT